MWETLASGGLVGRRAIDGWRVCYLRGVQQLSATTRLLDVQGQGQSCRHEEVRRQEEASQQLSYYAQEASLRE